MKEAIILYPCPAAGHFASMVELAKKLVLSNGQSNSLSVIILIATQPPPLDFASTTPPTPSTTTLPPSITFHHLPTVSLPQQRDPNSLNPVEICFELSRLQNVNFGATLNRLSQTSSIKAVVLDLFCNPAFDVLASASVNIPTYFYYTSGANALANLLYHQTIHETITTNLNDLNDYIYFPGTPPVHCLDVPEGFGMRNTNPYNHFLSLARNVRKCAGLLANTFEAFEPRAIKAIVEGLCVPNGTTPPLYSIGPLVAIPESSQNGQRHECLSWLDLHPRGSVVFLCFGSRGWFGEKQLKEIAIGLERSGHRFLWVLRSLDTSDQAEADLDLEALLPESFLERTKGKGLVVNSWMPQVDVLNHDSVGGFVTHCGWNSTLEAVLAGVPMLGWPLYAEQRINRVFLVEEMKVALPVRESGKERFVSSDELEKRVIELMEGESRKAVRDQVAGMRDAAKAAVAEGGSSTLALAKFLHSL